MTRNTLIALATAAALTFGFGASAQAKTNVNIDFGINLGGGLGLYDDGYGGGYYDAGYDEDENCGWQMVKKVKWNYSHTHKIVKWKKQWVCY
jgi:hypothetical protein